MIFFNRRAPLPGHERRGLGGLPLFLINPFKHFVRPIRAKRKRLEQGRNLGVKRFFADVGLQTPHRRTALFGATVVGVPLLNLGGDGAAASGTVKKPEKRLGLEETLLP